MLGPLGFLTKTTKDQTVITVRTKAGDTVYYVINNSAPPIVRASIGPTLNAAGVPFYDEAVAAPTTTPTSIADELAKLASLRDQGVLSESEFLAEKAKLLSRPG